MTIFPHPRWLTQMSCLLIVLCGITGRIQGQNLVPNPGFEEYNQLPTQENDFSALKHWFNPGKTATPGYFHLSGKQGAKIPTTARGTINLQSGKATVGITAYNGDSEAFRNYREYIAVKLKEPLVPGKRYQVQTRQPAADWRDH